MKKINKNRRKFLKLLAIGGGVGLTARLLGPFMFDSLSAESSDIIKTANFSGFKIEENKKGLTIFSKKGEEIFIIDNEK